MHYATSVQLLHELNVLTESQYTPQVKGYSKQAFFIIIN